MYAEHKEKRDWYFNPSPLIPHPLLLFQIDAHGFHVS